VPVPIPYQDQPNPSVLNPELDSFTLLGRATASVNESDLIVSDRRIADFRDFYAQVMVYPASGQGNLGTERPFVWFNDDHPAAYEASHRAHLIVADSPAASESPTIEHVKDQDRLCLVPPTASNFQVGAADVFAAWLHFQCMDTDNQYRITEYWTLGESTYTGTNKHPRHGQMIAQYIGAVANKRIQKIQLSFGGNGRLGAGSSISVYGKRSPLLDFDCDYSDQRSVSTCGVWMPTQKPLFRRLVKTLIPSPGSSAFFALPDTNVDKATIRVNECWLVNETLGKSEMVGHELRVWIDTDAPGYVFLESPVGARDLASEYEYVWCVLTWARP